MTEEAKIGFGGFILVLIMCIILIQFLSIN
jgi:hypothetical protein